MQVTIDSGSGFCFGVTSAIKKAEEELQRGPLFCLGDIVHNGQEVERLAKLGLETIDYDDLRTLHNVRVLLRAHGEPPTTYHIAKQNNIDIIDASCPVVLHLQKKIRDTYEQEKSKPHPAEIVIFGKRGHAEVIGLEGQTNNTARVIEGIHEIDQIDYTRDLYLFSQTTKSVDEFNALAEAIRQQSQEQSHGTRQVVVSDTICRNVANRVQKLQEFARQNDIIIFVGGKKSSNAKVLFQHCKDVNENTLFVSSADELIGSQALTHYPLSYSTRIGICGATSTPLWLMEEIKTQITQTTKITQNNANNVP